MKSSNLLYSIHSVLKWIIHHLFRHRRRGTIYLIETCESSIDPLDKELIKQLIRTGRARKELLEHALHN